MTEQYWADASTKNCVWLFQIKEKIYRECSCGAMCGEDGETGRGEECECFEAFWRTENVFLTNEEANTHGKARPYAWGEKNEGWRVYGVMCIGLMAELLGRHMKEFADKVEHISIKRDDKDE